MRRYPTGICVLDALHCEEEAMFGKLIAAGTLFLAALLAQAASASAANYNIHVINQSSDYIYFVRATNTGDDNWGGDLLGESEVIAPGGSSWVNVNDGSGSCWYDMQAEAEDGTIWENWEVNVCRLTTWTLYE